VNSLTIPGFFDLQVNGFGGVDFNTQGLAKDQLAHAINVMAATGVTRCLPTFITSSLEHFSACVKPWLQFQSPAVAGFHIEGPYINPEDGPRGAHPREFVAAPSNDDFDRRQDTAEGRIRLITLAPEIPGALELIGHVVERGVRVSIGHSNAGREQIKNAVSAGATLTTHLGNATPRTIQRYDNVIWQQLACDDLSAGLIVDGHHLDPDSVKVMIRAKTPERSILVTDAMAAAGQPPGHYSLGDIAVTLDAAGRAFREADGRLAGSALTMNKAVALATKFAGVTFEQAVAMASWQPARSMGEAPAGTLDVVWNPEVPHLEIKSVHQEP
jgi:N-acetylglucosamine-6-phosphate deacetylase